MDLLTIALKYIRVGSGQVKDILQACLDSHKALRQAVCPSRMPDTQHGQVGLGADVDSLDLVVTGS